MKKLFYVLVLMLGVALVSCKKKQSVDEPTKIVVTPEADYALLQDLNGLDAEGAKSKLSQLGYQAESNTLFSKKGGHEVQLFYKSNHVAEAYVSHTSEAPEQLKTYLQDAYQMFGEQLPYLGGKMSAEKGQKAMTAINWSANEISYTETWTVLYVNGSEPFVKVSVDYNMARPELCGTMMRMRYAQGQGLVQDAKKDYEFLDSFHGNTFSQACSRLEELGYEKFQESLDGGRTYHLSDGKAVLDVINISYYGQDQLVKQVARKYSEQSAYQIYGYVMATYEVLGTRINFHGQTLTNSQTAEQFFTTYDLGSYTKIAHANWACDRMSPFVLVSFTYDPKDPSDCTISMSLDFEQL